VIFEDSLAGIEQIAFPLGVIAILTPVTNPTSTVLYKSLMVCVGLFFAIYLFVHNFYP